MPDPYTLLHATPYAPIKGGQFGDIHLSITKEPFVGLNYREGKMVFSFENCLFNKVVIVNPEEIGFPDISISFSSCYIGEIEVGQITSDKVNLHFISSYLSGKIDNNKLQVVQVMNCFIHSSLFLMHLRKVQISLSSDGLRRFRESELLQRMGIKDFQQLCATKQGYYVYYFESFSFISDFDHVESTLGLSFRLSIFYGGETPDKTTKIQKGYFSSISLDGIAAGKIDVDNVRTTALYLHDFSPKEEASFYDLRPTIALDPATKFQIHQCNLDNAWFNNVAFGQFAALVIYRSNLNKSKFTGCTYPSHYEAYSAVENIHELDQKSEDYYKDLYEMFLQLKNALDGTSNSYESLKFQAFSLRALKKVKELPGQDRFLLYLNDTSNSHGLSIGRAFLWFLACSIFFYLLYLGSLGRLCTSNAFDPTLIGYYFSYIDITHRNDFLVSKNEFTGWSLAWDYLGKLVISYLIYQFIAAFRKYSKKV